MEDLERVEVFSGLSGFLYGAGNVGGTVNYILKRPTSYYLNDVTHRRLRRRPGFHPRRFWRPHR